MSTTQENRTIKVFTSKGAKKVVVTDASTWGELTPHLENDFDLANLQAAESVGKTTLVHRDAVLPAGDFILFLRPVKTKSGVNYEDMSYRELRARLTDSDKEQFKNYYNKNFTQASKAELVEFFDETEEQEESNVEINEVVTEATSDIKQLVVQAVKLLTQVLSLLGEEILEEEEEEVEEKFFTEEEEDDLQDLIDGFN